LALLGFHYAAVQRGDIFETDFVMFCNLRNLPHGKRLSPRCEPLRWAAKD